MTKPELPAAQDLTWLLGDLASRAPHVRAVVLASMDGLPKAAHGLGRSDTEYLSASVCTLFSIAGGTGDRLGVHGQVRQVVIELDSVLVFIAAAGQGTVLAVMTGTDADPGVIGYEMRQLVGRAQPHLATPARTGAQGMPG